MILLTADTHLTDRPEDEYRWESMEKAIEIVNIHSVDAVFILGDFVDRKDSHRGRFVNRVIDVLVRLGEKATVVILKGNHDAPISGPAYWEFLNSTKSDIHYVTEPTRWNDNLLLLPFTNNPKEDWKNQQLSSYKALFMHVTYPGAVAENGQVMEGSSLPLFRDSTKIYSGDIHTPQRFGNFVHVGSPHCVKFGDSYLCRMLLLNENTFEIAHEISLSPLRRLMIDICNVEDLARIQTKPGDQVKIRFACQPSQIDRLAQVEQAINDWMKTNELVAAGTEVIVQSSVQRDIEINQTPEYILHQYAAHAGVSEDLLAVGLELLKNA